MATNETIVFLYTTPEVMTCSIIQKVKPAKFVVMIYDSIECFSKDNKLVHFS
jgi:hypothetical protein